ncbi:chemotaxis protein CheW [Desulfohalovibrio reitneri]|uniref:chemotaxis protein CheW n=1 Tax=Desulfohalovibrio reitneri TaxID=1307759 RepID=UPI00054D10A4|nr:chemotaxis protein CheW [Desulfohalovibrio reitneri]
MDSSGQYLTFTLDQEGFGLDISTVREVLELTDITRIPRTPEFMRGVINLRGHAVPVMDLRRKFGLEPAEDTVNTCIIIVEVDMEGQQVVLGALADSVREVVDIPDEAIDPPPKMGAAIRTDFILGMGKMGEEFILLLDIDRVFSAEELAVAAEVREEAEAA